MAGRHLDPAPPLDIPHHHQIFSIGSPVSLADVGEQLARRTAAAERQLRERPSILIGTGHLMPEKDQRLPGRGNRKDVGGFQSNGTRIGIVELILVQGIRLAIPRRRKDDSAIRTESRVGDHAPPKGQLFERWWRKLTRAFAGQERRSHERDGNDCCDDRTACELLPRHTGRGRDIGVAQMIANRSEIAREIFGRGVPRIGFFREAALDHPSQRRRQRSIERIRLIANDRGQRLGRRRAAKRPRAADHLVQDRAE